MEDQLVIFKDPKESNMDMKFIFYLTRKVYEFDKILDGNQIYKGHDEMVKIEDKLKVYNMINYGDWKIDHIEFQHVI